MRYLRKLWDSQRTSLIPIDGAGVAEAKILELYPRIKFILGPDLEIIKDIFEYSVINLIYVSEKYKS